MDEWKYYEVTLEVSWMHIANPMSATVRVSLHAKSEGHAISRATEALGSIGRHTIEDSKARLAKL